MGVAKCKRKYSGFVVIDGSNKRVCNWRNFSGLLLSCVGIFILAALYEGLKWFRVHLQTVFESRQSAAYLKNRSVNGALLGENGRAAHRGSGDVYAPTTSESETEVRLNSR